MTFAISSLSEFKAYLGFVVLGAPDRFPHVSPFGDDPKANIEAAFIQLREGFGVIETKFKNQAQVAAARRLMDDAHEAYLAGERIRGAHLLQDIQELLFPNRFKEYEANEKGA